MSTTVITGVVISGTNMLTLEEFSYAIKVEREFILELVEHHLLEPEGKSPQEWRFDSISLRRGRIASSFYRDLGVNMQGIALALELLEKVDALKREIALREKGVTKSVV